MELPPFVEEVFRNWRDHLAMTPDLRAMEAGLESHLAENNEFPTDAAARIGLLAALATSMVDMNRPSMFVVYDGPIEGDFAHEVAWVTRKDRPNYRVKSSANRRAKRDLHMVLRTRGGDADAAYVAMRYLQRTFREVHVAVAEHSYSAGTLFLLGATRIHLSPVSVLGPLDFQVPMAHYLGEDTNTHKRADRSGSIEELMAVFEDVLERRRDDDTKDSKEWWSNYLVASGLTADVVGACLRHRAHARALAIRLLDPSRRSLPAPPEQIAEQLARGYDDHGFALDPAETKALLGEKVCLNSPLTEVAEALVELLWCIASPGADVQMISYEHDPAVDIGPDASFDDLCKAFAATSADSPLRFRFESRLRARVDANESDDDEPDEDENLDDEGEE